MARVVVMVDDMIVRVTGTGDDSRCLAKAAGSSGWKSLPSAGHVKRPHLYKLGTVALWEIHHYQKPDEFQTC